MRPASSAPGNRPPCGFPGGGPAEDVLCLGGVPHAGQLDDDESLPCCWMTGSATPSSLIRLCRVVMFCSRAESLADADRLRRCRWPPGVRSRPWSSPGPGRPGRPERQSGPCPGSRRRERITQALAFPVDAWRRFCVHVRGCQIGARPSQAASQCAPVPPGAGKWTPPRRSGRCMGSACRLVSQAGDALSR